DRRLLPALRAGGRRLHPLPGRLSHPRVTLALAVLAALRLVLEVLVVIEELLARCPDEVLVALDAHQTTVSVLHGLSSRVRPAPVTRDLLLALAADLLAASLSRPRPLGAAVFGGLQIEAVLLDVLDDVFLLDLPLEATEGVFDRFALLDLDLGQNAYTPCLSWISS